MSRERDRIGSEVVGEAEFVKSQSRTGADWEVLVDHEPLLNRGTANNPSLERLNEIYADAFLESDYEEVE